MVLIENQFCKNGINCSGGYKRKRPTTVVVGLGSRAGVLSRNPPDGLTKISRIVYE